MAHRKRLQAVALKDYPRNPDHTILQRAAHFLNWLAERAPGRPIKYPDLMKVCYGVARRPAEVSKEVALFRTKMTGVKKHLRETYGRAVIYCKKPGDGFYASFNADNVIEEDLSKKVRRIHSAHRSLAQTQDIIDPATIRNDANKQFYDRTMKVRKLLATEAILNKLVLPPKKDEKK